ncbi:MAG: phosrestin [Gammaproteobacteria bacterium]|nr:phosrestin [Gammaproteobacteria bacterium]MBU0771061.1 phosrestin [Gammaproteobacteria bacterium]MBU0854642.1 phosrestin [Gammaproteobacteria bacterium]MBU1845974.1 phosrestin [Gammaproteobacteria bacterium]
MQPDAIDFASLPWQPLAAGARCKAVRLGERQLRLLELTPEFVEPDWCCRGHTGIVLEGTLEIDFRGRVVRYPQGCGLSIAAGGDTAHKARAVTALVRLFLVEDA